MTLLLPLPMGDDWVRALIEVPEAEKGSTRTTNKSPNRIIELSFFFALLLPRYVHNNMSRDRRVFFARITSYLESDGPKEGKL